MILMPVRLAVYFHGLYQRHALVCVCAAGSFLGIAPCLIHWMHLHPDHFESIFEPLVPFICETHVPWVKRSDVTDCLETLSDHLRPAPDYTYA